MANQKITQLNSITWSSVDANNDVIPIVDVNDTSMAPSGTTKKISAGQLISSLVPQTRTLTINGTTFDLTANRSWTIATVLTVGTTPLTSGTVGRILFEGTGNVLQEDSALFWDNTNKLLGVGATPSTSVRLDVRAQGSLSTDIAFRIRNSGNSANILEIRGDNQFLYTNNSSGVSLPSTFTTTNNLNAPYIRAISEGNTSEASLIAARLAGSGVSSTATNRSFLYLANAGGNHSVISANDGLAFSVQAISTYNATSDQMRLRNGNLSIGTGYTGTARLDVRAQGALSTDIAFRVRNSADSNNLFRLSGNGSLSMFNGSAVTGLIDTFELYSADIVAGNAAPHFRTEAGDVIKLYKETTAVTAGAYASVGGSSVSSNDTFGGYSIGQVVQALKNLGILA